MIENGVISRYQLWLLIVNFILGGSILILPGSVIAVSKQDAWISFLIATMIGVIFSIIYVTLFSRFPKMTLVQIVEYLLGKKIGKIIGLLYAWFFLHLSSLLISDAIHFIGVTSLRETPQIVTAIMAGVLMFMIVYYGLEVMARSNTLFSYSAAFGFWISIFITIPYMIPEKLSPVLENGFSPVLKGVFPITGFPYSELVVFMMIFPFVNNKEKIGRIVISAVIIGGLTLFIGILTSILVLNVRPSEISLFAPYNMVRIINIANFFTRIEAIISFSYMLTVFAKLVISFYGSIIAIGQIFELDDYKFLISPLIIISVSLTFILNKNITEIIDVATNAWTPYSLLMGFVIPSILLVISYFKKQNDSRVL